MKDARKSYQRGLKSEAKAQDAMIDAIGAAHIQRNMSPRVESYRAITEGGRMVTRWAITVDDEAAA